jgi:hypothetical protein
MQAAKNGKERPNRRYSKQLLLDVDAITLTTGAALIFEPVYLTKRGGTLHWYQGSKATTHRFD